MTRGKHIGVAAMALCLAASGAAAATWRHYTDATLGVSIAYPRGWSIDKHYVFDALGPGHEIQGVAVQIPASMAAGTNLGGDSKLSVESLPGRGCRPSQFADPAQNVRTLHADGRTYRRATSEDAGAGNRYETEIFVIAGTSPCLAVRYFIHSSNIGNYDPGTVTAFDHDALVAAFDRIRARLRLAKQAA